MSQDWRGEMHAAVKTLLCNQRSTGSWEHYRMCAYPRASGRTDIGRSL
jgi:hypothetical protein